MKLSISETRLSNGLTVLYRYMPNSVVTLDMWVATGSANEDDQINGISHYLEHMMFKGTPRFGPGELDNLIMDLGGVWNAGTSKDFTHYYVTVAAPFFSQALDGLSDMMQNSLIDREEFDKEKLVILEEYRRKEDNPFGVLFDELYDAAYESGPYRRTVLGTFDSIKQTDRDVMHDYYRRYYTPSNMKLLIIGDISEEDAFAGAQEAFANWNGPEAPQAILKEPVTYRTGETRILKKPVNESYAGFAYPAPAVHEIEKVAAVDLAMTVLTDGRSSRLYRRLKDELHLVTTLSGGFSTHKYEGLIYLACTLDSGDLETLQRELKLQFEEFVKNPVKPDELGKARRIIRNSLLFGMETASGQSSLFGHYDTIAGGIEYLNQYMDLIAEMDSLTVTRLAAPYLAEHAALVIVEPESNPGEPANAVA